MIDIREEILLPILHKIFLRCDPCDYHGKTKLLTYLCVFSMQRQKASQEFPVNPTDVLTNASVTDSSSNSGIEFYLFICRYMKLN